jgi:2-oxo-4-hydroxy-4-carboxy--5-ureidoimidazoline (OHCU) decarboxylase
VRELPGKLTVDELAELFEGRTALVARLAELDHPLERAPEVIATLSETEKIEALAAHPAIGQQQGLSPRSRAEQGADVDPQVMAELKTLNRAYEERFGFRFVVFVDGRAKRELVPVLRERLGRPRDEELDTALAELVAIAADRWRRG